MTDQSNKPQGTFSKLMSSTLPNKEQNQEILKKSEAQTEAKSSTDAILLASKQDSSIASKQSSMIAITTDVIENIRKVVKYPGKEEVLYVRLSKEEKDSLADVSYTYKRQSIKTSDNEIVRVAVNAILEDYKTNGANSLLAKVIESLHD
jgi:hypothetical protein